MPFEIVRIPVWVDNYAWLLLANDGTAAVVDSPEAPPVLEELRRRGRRLTHIFNTHHHFDHVGSNAALSAAFPGLEVFGSRYDAEHDRIPGLTRVVSDGETFVWGGERCTVREVPGHTLGHIAYLFQSGAAFVGDTLFVGGCGRLFEGTARQLDAALNEVLAGLDPATRLYCAHEYTQANLRFARHVDPNNAALIAYAEEVDGKRAAGLPTVPSNLADELEINPFLRCDTPAVRSAVGAGSDEPRHSVLGALRALKDGFRA